MENNNIWTVSLFISITVTLWARWKGICPTNETNLRRGFIMCNIYKGISLHHVTDIYIYRLYIIFIYMFHWASGHNHYKNVLCCKKCRKKNKFNEWKSTLPIFLIFLVFIPPSPSWKLHRYSRQNMCCFIFLYLDSDYLVMMEKECSTCDNKSMLNLRQ